MPAGTGVPNSARSKVKAATWPSEEQDQSCVPSEDLSNRSASARAQLDRRRDTSTDQDKSRISRSKTSSSTRRGSLRLVTQSEMLLPAERASRVQKFSTVGGFEVSRKKMMGEKACGGELVSFRRIVPVPCACDRD